ncbi:MAG: hypothetical protein HDQ87_09170 [Clostridia bacterium]|nr:hypothetical protein [Clostridia bacterium]
MPQISAFTLCSEIVDNVSGEGILEPELRNPQPALRPRFIPTECSFGVYLGILGIGPESDNELEFRLDDADGKTVTQIGPITVPTTAPGGANVPPEYRYAAFVLRLQNVNLETEGIYQFKTLYNCRELENKLVPVYRQAETS